MTSSYSQILRSSAITGGAAGISMLIGMVSVKFGAVLLGPAAFGQLRVFQSCLGFAGSLANLGIQQSAVQRIARAIGHGDLDECAKITKAARRIAWMLGVAMWLLISTLSWPLSHLIFGTHEQAIAIAILATTIPFSAVTASRLAVHRGFRRIGDLARINVLTAGASTAVSVGLYAWLRESGIVPSIVCTSVIAFAVPLLFRRRLPTLPTHSMPMADTLRFGKSMVGLGVAMLTASLASALVGVVISSLITRELGASAMGIYAAAWGLSGLFANFILNAMGQDYFPRVSAASHDTALVSRLVNEQTSLGVLLALPGLVATVVFAPLAIAVFYSAEFQPAAELLPWYALGTFGRVTSWPLGFAILARQQAKTYVAIEICFAGLWISLTQLGLAVSGLAGVAWAFCAVQAIYTALVLFMVGRGSEIGWRFGTVRLVMLSLTLFGGVALTGLLPGPWNYIAGGVGVIVAGLSAVRGLAARLGRDHRLVRHVASLPLVHRVLP